MLSVVIFNFGKLAGRVESFAAKTEDIEEAWGENGIDPSKFI